jgi:ubiquinol-cytochrome c reductase cytochrome b subunit
VADPMFSPVHIKPEWYFLFAYSVLRAFENKLLGIFLIAITLVVVLMPILLPKSNNISWMKVTNVLLVTTWMFRFLLLTWTGGKAVEYPFFYISQLLTSLYFLCLTLLMRGSMLVLYLIR